MDKSYPYGAAAAHGRITDTDSEPARLTEIRERIVSLIDDSQRQHLHAEQLHVALSRLEERLGAVLRFDPPKVHPANPNALAPRANEVDGRPTLVPLAENLRNVSDVLIEASRGLIAAEERILSLIARVEL